jgi:uncharacterized caspase-like protein
MPDLRFLFKTRYGVSRALIIGIDQYVQAPPLSYAVSDAIAIKEALIEKFAFPASEVVVQTDTAATKQAILRSFLRYALDDVNVDDRLVVFFAGHGHTLSGSRGEVGYLVPHDANMADYSTFVRWDELTRNADLVRAKHVLFVMDACYGGLALTRAAHPGTTRFLKDMMLRRARQVLTAGKADEVVADSGGPIPNHSVFTGHLLEALAGRATGPDGVMTASGVMAYVYSKVATDHNSHQTPHYGYIDGDGDMILAAPGLDELDSSDTKDLDRLVSIPYAPEAEDLLGASTKVRRAKALLAAESGAIELHDLLMSELRRFLSLTSEDVFAVSETYSQDAFVSRLARYEEAVGDLALLLACVAHWGRPSHLSSLQKCIARSSDRLGTENGLVVWLALRWYPLLIELYCIGMAAIDGGRFDSLATAFAVPIGGSDYDRSSLTFVEAASNALLELNRTNVLGQIPGHERKYTPLSDYLLKVLQPRLDDALFLGKSYESTFDTFEVFFALVTADARVARGGDVWGPIGRFGWKRDRDNGPLARLIAEASLKKADWPPLKAGLFGGSYERFEKVARQFVEITSRLGWF